MNVAPPPVSPESGWITVHDARLSYGSAQYGSWERSVSDVVVIGEYTNQSGPFRDDYFFVFVTRSGEVLEASFYARGRDEALRQLSGILGMPIDPALCNSTDFRSRVIWPLALRDHPVYDFVSVPPQGSWAPLQRLLRIPAVARSLTAELRAYVASHP